MRHATVAIAALLAALPARAQTRSPAPDTTRLETLEIKVTRAPEASLRIPAAVGVVDSAAFRGARLQGGLDETLGRIPGVYVANRFNPSLDQRLALRGAGARANFGVRGIKILLDGLPQTLPDGQSQLTNVDLGLIDRAEVLIGPSSAWYGNAGGGVISLASALPAGPAAARLRVTAGSFGTTRVAGQLAGAAGLWSGSAGFTSAHSDGFRQHSTSDTRQLTLGLNRIIGERWLARARYYFTDAPRAENPGALTLAEYRLAPDSAAANNILRGADKAVRQHQFGLTLTEERDDGSGVEATVFGLTRDLVNPLATAPPGPAGPTVGTFSAIDRVAGGARFAWRRRLGGPNTRLALGLDAQTMRDDRINRRSNGGAPSDTIVAEQRERATEFGPFASLHLEPVSRLLLTGTIRYDRVRFTVADRFLTDGSDDSGERSMGAVSASGGVSWALPAGAWYLNVGSAFETPTTTELVALPTGRVGLNANLGPQRTASIETGIRLRGTRGGLTAAVYRSAVHDALIQAREQDGRAVFENAGRLRIQGVELGLDWRPARGLTVGLTYTHTDATFRDYRIRSGATVDTLDGNAVPGVPRHLFRGVATGSIGPVVLEWEQQLVAAFFADDRNAIEIPGQGAGVTDVRIRLALPGGERLAMTPFAGVSNLFDRDYVAAATVNGFGGRTFEPAPGRWFHLGIDARFRL